MPHRAANSVIPSAERDLLLASMHLFKEGFNRESAEEKPRHDLRAGV